MMEYMSHSFPTMFKGSEAQPGQDGTSAGGQKVVCTPEVSLYQYTSPEMGPAGVVPSIRSEEKSGNTPDIGLLPLRISDTGSGASGAGSTSSTGGFQCGFCGKSFQQKNTFQNHLRSHREGEDPYQCDICGKTFAGETSLKYLLGVRWMLSEVRLLPAKVLLFVPFIYSL